MIPKIFYQSWDEEIPSIVLDETMKYLPKDIQYIRYSLTDISQYLRNKWGNEALNMFNSYKHIAHKIDFWRYYMLYDTGGIYMDADCVLTNEIDDKLFSKNAVFVNNNRGIKNIFNGFFMISPRNEIMRQMINYMMQPSTINHQKNYYFNCQYLYKVIMENSRRQNIYILMDKRIGNYFYVIYKKKILLQERSPLYPYNRQL